MTPEVPVFVFLLAASPALATAPMVVVESEPITTLNPLYPSPMADERAQELVFDRLFKPPDIT